MKTKDLTVVDVLYQDIQHLEKTVAELTAQINRFHRVVKVDEREAAVAEKVSQTELVRAVQHNSVVVSSLLNRMAPDENSLWEDAQRVLARKQDTEKWRRLQHIEYLRRCRQEVTPQCACGKHKGIRFLDADVVVDELCPVAWWVKQSRLAFEKGILQQFQQSTPMETYLLSFILT
jgi:hypothetical protein